ncbi:MAG: NADPH-dependent F420 reductase [Archaeoglobaceae archaeon]
MKIAILGGTGNLGIGLSLRFAILGYDVIVGSRDEKKAKTKAEEYSKILFEHGYTGKITGMVNSYAAKQCDLAVITVPYEQAFKLAENLKVELAGKVVVSPLVPMKREGRTFRYIDIPEGSAAEKIAKILEKSKIVSAYHNIPAERFADLSSSFDWDVLVCGDDFEAKEKIIRITNEIRGLRALDCGDLRNSKLIESLTVLILNIMVTNKMEELGIKFC